VQTLFVLVLTIALSAHTVFAADGVEEKKKMNPALTFALAEGLFVVNSGLASASPEYYGIALTLISPLGMNEKASNITNGVIMGSAVSLGLYNAVELRKDNYSKSDVFARNMYVWHAFAAMVYLSELITGNKIESDKVAVVPIEKGMGVAISVNF
jgi:hypothetical protein